MAAASPSLTDSARCSNGCFNEFLETFPTVSRLTPVVPMQPSKACCQPFTKCGRCAFAGCGGVSLDDVMGLTVCDRVADYFDRSACLDGLLRKAFEHYGTAVFCDDQFACSDRGVDDKPWGDGVG